MFSINLFALSGLFIAILSFILIVILLLYGKTKLHRVWTLFNLAVCVWGLGTFIAGYQRDPKLALIGWQIGLCGGVFTATFFYHTAYIFCEIHKRKTLLFAYSLPVITNILFYFKNVIPLDKWNYLFNEIYYYKATVVYLVIMSGWVIIASIGFYELLRYLNKSRGIKHTQTLYFCFGTLFGFAGGVTVHLPSLGVPIYPIGNFGVAIYAMTVTYAILRYKLLDIRVFISRAAAFLISYPIFLSIPFVFAYRMYGIIYPVMGVHWWLLPAVLIVFFASLAPLAYGQLRIRMEERLLAEQKRYQKILLQAASGMATEHDLNKLARLIVYIVKRAVKIDFSAIFIEDKASGVYRMKAFRDHQRVCPYDSITFLHEHPFIQYLAKYKEPCLYDELPANIRHSLGELSGASLIVPSAVADNLLGFVILGAKLNKQPYGDDDINVFKILSHQAALAIENSLFMDETKQAQEKIFTAEKLASIGGMADGVAHQIKNRLNQFSVASGELRYEIRDFLKKHPGITKGNKDLKRTLDYLVSIADSLITNVKRTDGIVKGILNFARVEETSTFFSHFSLKESIDLSTELLRIKHEIAEAPLEVDLGSSDNVYGVKAQITEAVYNLMDNAYEATQEKKALLAKEGRNDFKPLIKVKLSQKAHASLLEISDNGIGMRDENKPKVFAPFFTTKSSYKSGTGIGMYVVKRMVEENHRGKVSFTSSYMEGTKFFVELPKK